MRTAGPEKAGGADANRKAVEHGFSSTSAAPGQVLTNVPPPWRRLGVIVDGIVAAIQRRRHADFAVALT